MPVQCRTLMDQDALYALNDYHLRHHKQMRSAKASLITAGALGLVIFAIGLVFDVILDSGDILSLGDLPVIGLIAGLILLLYATVGLKSASRRAVRKQLAAQGPRMVDHTIAEEGVYSLDESNGTRSFHPWSTIESLAQQGRYAIGSLEVGYLVFDANGFGSDAERWDFTRLSQQQMGPRMTLTPGSQPSA
ncbi:hypothetical protein [Acidipropionibacterium jensenii]|uniref:hypothetical protein n=1 Tax=Acidipropionibacterium jensenii TaxID=1749 RepID=UPI00214B8BA1|nr:hypothetical protein [Acidipropionibacterium jensenii]